MTIKEFIRPVVSALASIDPVGKFNYGPYVSHIKKSIKFCLESQTGINVKYDVGLGEVELLITQHSPSKGINYHSMKVVVRWSTTFSGDTVNGECVINIPCSPTVVLKIR